MGPPIIPLLQKCGSFWQARNVFCNIKEISHASAGGAFHSFLLFLSPALFYPDRTERREAFSLEGNLTGITGNGQKLPHITVFD